MTGARARCKAADCGEPVKALGLCSTHYARHYVNGDPRVDVPRGELANVGGGTLTAGDVLAAIPELTARQLDYWVRTGIHTPTTGAVAVGSGKHRTYTDGDIDRLRQLACLVGLGIPPRRAAALIDAGGALTTIDGRAALLLDRLYAEERASG